MNTIPNESTCPKCGKPVSLNAFEGLCPECLMQAGFGTVTGNPGEEKTSAFVPPTPEELAGHFPQLEIIELLGRGGMGAVYKARQTHLDRIVALKILPPGVNRDPSFAERFVREAKALAKLHHPHIVTLYESGQADELFYFLMEFVDGVNLRQLLAAGTVSPKDALAIVPQICDALQFAHDRGIVHRDIKPENILLSKAGQVKIADFGVAKLVAGELPESPSSGSVPPGESQTEAGKVIGTPQYMAPEQLSHPLDVDNRADIYALGVVFYQMLTGELPAGKFEPPSSKVQIDVRLDDIVLRALQKRPELRYQQASALKTQIETIVSAQSLPSGLESSPILSRTGPGLSAVPDQGTPSQKGRTLAISGAILQLAAIGLPLASLWQLQKFAALNAHGPTNINAVADVVGVTVTASLIAGLAFFTGLVFLCISLTVSRYRAKWFFRFLTIYSWPLLFLFPLGTAAGVFFLVYCLSRREEFTGVAETSPPLSQIGPGHPNPPPIETTSGNSNHSNRYLVPILRWLLVAFSIFVLTVLSGFYVTNEVLPKVYTATAQFQVLPRGLVNQNQSYSIDDPTSLQAEIEIIQSSDVLLPVITDMQLDKIWAKRVDKSGRVAVLPPQDALDYMRSELKLDVARGTNIVNITVSSEVSKEAADIANAVADRYKTMRDVEQDQRTKRDEDSLRYQIAQQQKVVDDKKAVVEKIQRDLGQKGIETAPGADDPGKAELDARKKDLQAAQRDYDARTVLLDSVGKLPDDQFLSVLDGLGRSEPDINNLRAEILQKQTDITGLLNGGFAEGQPQVQSLKTELEAEKKQLADMVAGVRRAMQVDTDMAKSRVALFQKEVDDLTNMVAQENTGNGLAPFRDAQRDLEQQQNLLATLNVRLNQVVGDNRLQESPVRIISRAEPPENPTKPNKNLCYVITIMAGLFLGVALASLVEFAVWFFSPTRRTSGNNKSHAPDSSNY